MMKIVIWWRIPCKGISGVIKELSKFKDIEIVAITGNLSDSRKSMGWDEFTFYPATHIFLEEKEWLTRGKALILQYSNFFHIFNGYYFPQKINKLITFSIQNNVRFGIFSEAPSNPYKGVKKLLAYCYHYLWLPFKVSVIIKHAEFIFCLSGSDRKEIKKLKNLGWPENKIVPFGYFTEDNTNYTSINYNDVPLIFCPGNLVAHKGVDILIKSLNILHKNGLNFHCHITGDGDEKMKLVRMVNKYGLMSKITFHGVLDQNEFNKLKEKMDILVAPGRIEPWGIRINEAIQNGQAVIVSDKIGASELIKTSGSGLIFESGNYNILAQKLNYFLSDPDKLKYAKEKAISYRAKIQPKIAAKYLYDVINYYLSNTAERPGLPPWLN